MALTPGTRVGPYAIAASLGAGGMGEVYRARDTALDRDVAIKVLPDVFAADAERVARFEREARTLAALNHPHIAQVYGFVELPPAPATAGDAQGGLGWGGRAIVMELVEGQTLADRVTQGAVPMDEALGVARQIAEALEAAHELGVVHRDLKPANVKLRDDGVVKVLDFGLAKILDPTSAASGEAGRAVADPLGLSPTMTSPAVTRAGIILGTAAYMAPEQAKGCGVDRRADIWAFGCVLFEMLTGRPAFPGEDVSDTLASVLRTDPAWADLPADAPQAVRRLLRRCLVKDVRQRLGDIRDARLEIEEAMAGAAADAESRLSSIAPALVGGPARWLKAVWALAGASLAAAVLLAVVLAGVWPRAAAPQPRPLTLSLVHAGGRDVGTAAISPDGTRVAYGARRADGMPVLWVQGLSSGEARVLEGTEGAAMPFWSPDSRDIGFFGGLSLKRVPAGGGRVEVMATGVAGAGGAWAPDGTIVVGANDAELLRVSAAPGSTPAPLTSLPGSDWTHCWPSFLPDGRRFLFTAKHWTSAAEASGQGIYIGSLDGAEPLRLLPDLSSAVYAAPGYLVFARNGVLHAAPFDLMTGTITGDAVALGDDVATNGTYYLAAVSAAADGTLALRPPPSIGLGGTIVAGGYESQLRVLDRLGAGRAVGDPQWFSHQMDLNPDGRRLAVKLLDRSSATGDVWIVDLQTGGRTPVTANRRDAGAPAWSSDGTRLAYSSQPQGHADDVHIQDMRTGQIVHKFESPDVMEHPVVWSHDGSFLIVLARGKGRRALTRWDLGSKDVTLIVEPAMPFAALSPDDRFLAYTSAESGRPEAMVTAFPSLGKVWPLTTEGGYVLSWSSDGREILVATLSGHVVAYPVSTAGGFAAGLPAMVVRDVGFGAQYSAAAPDHSKIVVRVSPDDAKDKGEIRLLFDWQHRAGPASRQ